MANRKSPRREEAEKPSAWINRVGAEEISALFLGGFAILLLLAFVSYTPKDLPSWVPFARDTGSDPVGVYNFVGPVGALVAGYGYFFFGAASFLIPAVLFWWTAQVISAGRFLHCRNYFVFATFIGAAACLIEYQSILFQDWVELYNLPKSPGGFCGSLIGRQIFAKFLGSGGSIVFMTTTYLIALIIITGIHPFRFLALICSRLSFYWGKLSSRPRA